MSNTTYVSITMCILIRFIEVQFLRSATVKLIMDCIYIKILWTTVEVTI